MSQAKPPAPITPEPPPAIGREPGAKSPGAERPGPGLGLRLADAGLVIGFLALAFLLGCFPMKDTDFWWHLKAGDWIRENGRVPRTDLFTFTVPDRPWIDLHWGFQVCLSWAYQHWGIVGVNLAKNAVTCAALLMLITARRRTWPVWVMVLAWLPALAVLSGRMYVRPETFTLFHLSAFLAILSRWRDRPWLAWLLPVVQVLWVNSQGLFVLGPIILAFALIDAALAPGAFSVARRSWWRTAGIVSGLTLLACLVNPYGVEGTLFPLALSRTMSSPIFRQTIAELTPIPEFIRRAAGLRNPMLLLHLGTMLLGALSFLVPMAWRASVRVADLAGGRREGPATGRGKAAHSAKKGPKGPAPEAWRLSPFRLLLFVAFSALSWQATRNSHQFAAVVGAITAWNFGEWAAAVAERRRSLSKAKAKTESAPSFARLAVPRVATFAALGLGLASVASGAFYAFTGEGRVVGLGFEPLWFPHDAVKFAGRPEMPPRFASFGFGWASLYDYYFGPDRKVFIDPRLEVAGPDLYERYIELDRKLGANTPGWQAELEALGRPVVMIGHAGLTDPGENARAGAALLADPAWTMVYLDPQASIYVHNSYDEVVRAHRVDLAGRHYRPDPATEPVGLPALKAMARSLWSYALTLGGMGRIDLVRTVVPLGLDAARRVLRSDPDDADAAKLMALLMAAREIPSNEPVPRYRLPYDPVFDLGTLRTTAALVRALEARPDDFLLRVTLLFEYQARGMSQAMRPLLESLTAHTPINQHQLQLRPMLEGLLRQIPQETDPAGAEGPPRNRNELERRLNALLAEGRAASAASLIEAEIPAESRDWPTADRLATLRMHLGEPAKARDAWQRAAAPPRPALKPARLALTYLVEGDFDRARGLFREAVATDPELFEAWYGLAVLEADAGRAAEAVEAAGRAEASAPGDAGRAAARRSLDEARPYGAAPGASHSGGSAGITGDRTGGVGGRGDRGG